MALPTIQVSDFDQEVVNEYSITEHDLAYIYHYLQAMQAHLDLATWDDICIGGYYGTSALLHEVIEIRILMNRETTFLSESSAHIRGFARLPQNRDAHVRGLEAEYGYLQRVIQSLYDVQINIGALLKINSKHPQDWDDLFDRELPFFDPSPQELNDAKRFLAQLRDLERRMP